MATAQDYLKNEKWIARMKGVFTILDTNKNGYITWDDMELYTRNLEKVITDRPVEMAKLKEASRNYYHGGGLTEDMKMNEQEFIEHTATMIVGEVAKYKRGEETLFEKFSHASFDVVDHNHDGNITWEEYWIVAKANGFDEKSARGAFDAMDLNKNGKIDRKECVTTELKYWLNLDDKDSDELFKF